MSNQTHGYDNYGTKKTLKFKYEKMINGEVLGTKVRQK
jgi:hypothetical protein